MRNEQKTALRYGGPVASTRTSAARPRVFSTWICPWGDGLLASTDSTGSCGQNTAPVALFTSAGNLGSVAAECPPWSGSTELLATSPRLSWRGSFSSDNITRRRVSTRLVGGDWQPLACFHNKLAKIQPAKTRSLSFKNARELLRDANDVPA